MRARQIAKQLSCVPEKQEFSYIDTVYECQNEWIGWSNLVKLQRKKIESNKKSISDHHHHHNDDNGGMKSITM